MSIKPGKAGDSTAKARKNGGVENGTAPKSPLVGLRKVPADRKISLGGAQTSKALSASSKPRTSKAASQGQPRPAAIADAGTGAVPDPDMRSIVVPPVSSKGPNKTVLEAPMNPFGKLIIEGSAFNEKLVARLEQELENAAARTRESVAAQESVNGISHAFLSVHQKLAQVARERGELQNDEGNLTNSFSQPHTDQRDEELQRLREENSRLRLMLADCSSGAAQALAANSQAQVPEGMESQWQPSVSVKASGALPGKAPSAQAGTVRHAVCISPRITRRDSLSPPRFKETPRMVSHPEEDRGVQRQHSPFRVQRQHSAALAVSYPSLLPPERQQSMQLLAQERQQSAVQRQQSAVRQQPAVQLATQAVGYTTVPGSLQVTSGPVINAARPISPRAAGPFVSQARGHASHPILSQAQIQHVENHGETEQSNSGVSPQVSYMSPLMQSRLGHQNSLNSLGCPRAHSPVQSLSFLPKPRAHSPVPGRRLSQPLSGMTSVVTGPWPAASGLIPSGWCISSPRPFGNP